MTERDDSALSRRGVVGGAGLGLAAAAAGSPAAAQGAGPTAAPFVDPTTKYPKPPFQAQSQPWPGLAGKMDPAAGPRGDELQGLGPPRSAARR